MDDPLHQCTMVLSRIENFNVKKKIAQQFYNFFVISIERQDIRRQELFTN